MNINRNYAEPIIAGLHEFRVAVRKGLGQQPRSIPPKFFYDANGSRLFDLICTTAEYYPTRTETGILREFSSQMIELIGPSCLFIELGSGSASKTPLLLQHLSAEAAYVPVDICQSHLQASTVALKAMFPDLRIFPICADYTKLNPLKFAGFPKQRRVIFFPGSTIGNSTPQEAVELLRDLAELAGESAGLLIGVDCKKAPELLNSAYNDRNGYTEEFNFNLLLRMRNELGAIIDLQGFSHYAFYNIAQSRIEMHLVSRCRQSIELDGEFFHFEIGESIHTENSYKYNAAEFQKLAMEAGWRPQMLWKDADGLFNIHYFFRA